MSKDSWNQLQYSNNWTAGLGHGTAGPNTGLRGIKKELQLIAGKETPGPVAVFAWLLFGGCRSRAFWEVLDFPLNLRTVRRFAALEPYCQRGE